MQDQQTRIGNPFSWMFFFVLFATTNLFGPQPSYNCETLTETKRALAEWYTFGKQLLGEDVPLPTYNKEKNCWQIDFGDTLFKIQTAEFCFFYDNSLAEAQYFFDKSVQLWGSDLFYSECNPEQTIIFLIPKRSLFYLKKPEKETTPPEQTSTALISLQDHPKKLAIALPLSIKLFINTIVNTHCSKVEYAMLKKMPITHLSWKCFAKTFNSIKPTLMPNTRTICAMFHLLEATASVDRNLLVQKLSGIATRDFIYQKRSTNRRK